MGNAFNRRFFFDTGGCILIDRNAKNPRALAAVTAPHDGGAIGGFPDATRDLGEPGPVASSPDLAARKEAWARP